MKKQKNKRKAKELGELKPGGKLRLRDCFNTTKEQEYEFMKATRKEKQEKEKEIDFEIGAARMSLKSARSLLNLMG